MQVSEFTSILRSAGLKATPGRLAVLELFKKMSKPLSVRTLLKQLRHSLDEATIYRMVNILTDKKVLRTVDLQHDHLHYELNTHQHHHLVCRSCSKIAEIPHSDIYVKTAQLLTDTHFKTIDTPSIELFGICKSCSKNKAR